MPEIPPKHYRLVELFERSPVQLAELFRQAADALDARAQQHERDAIGVALDDLSQASAFNALARECVEAAMAFASAATELELTGA